MGFSEKQVGALQRHLNGTHVRVRKVQGRELPYIEGWHAIGEANRIFGFDCWDRETVETRCVLGRENRGTFHVVYVAKVRITVRAQGEIVVREGYGTGEAQLALPGEAHEKALKTAETDATKRALATFGRPFGLSLYVSGANGRDRSSLSKNGTAPIADQDRRRTLQRLGPRGQFFVPRRQRAVLDPALAAEVAARINGDASSQQSNAPTDHGSANAPVGDPAEPNEIEGPPIQPPTAETGPSSPDDQVLMIERLRRRREPAHLRFVGSQPCLICGRTPSDAHHLRFAQPRAFGRKVSDEFTVPLCRTHHRQVHQTGNEPEWWTAVDGDIDPLAIARGLWEQTQSGQSPPPSPLSPTI